MQTFYSCLRKILNISPVAILYEIIEQKLWDIEFNIFIIIIIIVVVVVIINTSTCIDIRICFNNLTVIFSESFIEFIECNVCLATYYTIYLNKTNLYVKDWATVFSRFTKPKFIELRDG